MVIVQEILKGDYITIIIKNNIILIGIVSGNSNVLKVIVQEVLITDEFSVIAQEVLMGDTSLIVIVVIMAVKGETFSIK